MITDNQPGGDRTKAVAEKGDSSLVEERQRTFIAQFFLL